MTDAQEKRGVVIGTRLGSGVLLALLVQAVVVGMYAQRLSSAIDAGDARVARLEDVVAANRKEAADARARIEEKLALQDGGIGELRVDVAGIRSTMEHVARQVDRIVEREERRHGPPGR